MPSCLGWPEDRFRLVIGLAGQIDANGPLDLLGRIGAISNMRGLQYWSVAESAWKELVEDASAVEPDSDMRRADFRPDEITPGAVLRFIQKDNRSASPVAYRMRVLAAADDRVAVEIENATPIKAFFVTLFPPGSMRTAHFFQRIEGTMWGFYSISAATEAANSMVKLGTTSYVNRANAIYGHLANPDPRTLPPP